MRDLDDLFTALARSRFRSRFRLDAKDLAYLRHRTLPVILEHGRKFLLERLAPAQPRNDGRQTPMRGHPVFPAQHATATCCRGCLAKWHFIPTGRELGAAELDYIVKVLQRWLLVQASDEQTVGIERDGKKEMGSTADDADGRG